MFLARCYYDCMLFILWLNIRESILPPKTAYHILKYRLYYDAASSIIYNLYDPDYILYLGLFLTLNFIFRDWQISSESLKAPTQQFAYLLNCISWTTDFHSLLYSLFYSYSTSHGLLLWKAGDLFFISIEILIQLLFSNCHECCFLLPITNLRDFVLRNEFIYQYIEQFRESDKELSIITILH